MVVRISAPSVIHFSSVHPSPDPRIFYKQCRTLAAAGFDVTWIAPGAPPPDPGEVTFIGLPTHDSRLTRAVAGTREVAKVLRRTRADLYHFHDPELLPLGLWLRLTGRRVIYDAHESVRDDVIAKPYLGRATAWLLSRAAGTIEDQVGARLTHVVSATPIIAGQFRFPTTIVANFPILDEWSAIDCSWPNYQARPRSGAYVGGIIDFRCTNEMIAAAKIVVADDPDFQLVFAGSIDETDPDPEGPGVVYLGNLPRDQVPAVLGRARFGVVLFKELPNLTTAMPTKFFEYMAAGIPIIVSRSMRVLSRVTEVERCGLIVDQDDPADIARAMTYLLDHPDEAYEMGRRGREAAHARFSWASEGRRLVRLYQRLLGMA